MVLVAKGIEVHSERVDSGIHLSNLFAEVLNSFNQQVVLHGGHLFNKERGGLASTSPLAVEEVAVVNIWTWCVLVVIVILIPK
jgi:hypothetical protein